MLRKISNLLCVLLLFSYIALLATFSYYVHYPKDLSHYTILEVSNLLTEVRGKTQIPGDKIATVITTIQEFQGPNAWISQNTIVINENLKYEIVQVTVTRGMLQMLKNRDSLATVLGHEWGHYLNGDTNSSLKRWIPVLSEQNADFIGAGLANRAGYDACYIKDFWLAMHNRYRDNRYKATSHPHSIDRYNALKCNVRWVNKMRDTFKNSITNFYNRILY